MIGRVIFTLLGLACHAAALAIIGFADSDQGVANGRGPDPAQLGSAYVLSLTGIGFMVAAASFAVANHHRVRAGAAESAGFVPPGRVGPPHMEQAQPQGPRPAPPPWQGHPNR